MVKRRVKPKKINSSKNRVVPLPIKLLSILYYFAGGFAILAGLALMFGSAILEGFSDYIPFSQYSDWIVLFVLGVFVILLGIFIFFVARGLWKGKKWSRTAAIVLTIFGAMSALSEGSFFSFLFDVIIAAYLWFNEDVKKSFR